MNYKKLILCVVCTSIACIRSMIKTCDQIPALSHKEMMLFNYVRVGYIGKTLELLQGCVNVNVQDTLGYTPIMLAAFYDDIEMLRNLVAKGADLNIQNIYGHTALALATYFGRLEIVKFLLQQKSIMLNLKDCEGDTVLDLALRSPHDNEGKIAQLLLEQAEKYTIELPEAPELQKEPITPVQNEAS